MLNAIKHSVKTIKVKTKEKLFPVGGFIYKEVIWDDSWMMVGIRQIGRRVGGLPRRQEEPVCHGQEWQAVQCIPREENIWKNIVGYKIGDRQSRFKCQARVFGHVSEVLGTKQVHFSELCLKRPVWTWVCEMTWRKDSSWKNLVKQYGWSTEGDN